MRTDTSAPLYITFTNAGSLDMCINLIYSLRKSGVPLEQIEVHAVDQASAEALRELSVPLADRPVDEGDAEYSAYWTSGFAAMMHGKIHYIHDTLVAGRAVVYLDSDIVVQRSIEHAIARYKDDFDILIQTDALDGPPDSELCAGFQVARPTSTAIAFYRICIERHLKRRTEEPNEGDQPTVNRVYRERATYPELADLRLRVLDVDQFAHGQVAFKTFSLAWRTASRFPPLAWLMAHAPRRVMIHNNYIRGREKKLRRFRRYGLWYAERPDVKAVIAGRAA
ncbi:MAG: putative nucleotide-diphospho-sugar transferase [Planctomycetota bacterium]